MPQTLLDTIGDPDRTRLLERAVRHEYGTGECVFVEGDRSDSLHLIEAGKVAIRASTPEGDIATFTVLTVGECFGELTMTEPGSVRSATVEALEPTTTIAIGRADFDELRQDHPSVDRFLVMVLAAEAKRLSELALEALYVPVEQRLLNRLDHLVRIYDEGDRPVVIPLTQTDLASMAGTTRPTANQVLKRLEADGAIRVGRSRIEVVRPISGHG